MSAYMMDGSGSIPNQFQPVFRSGESYLSALLFVSVALAVITALIYFVYGGSNSYFALFFIWYGSLIATVAIPAARYRQCSRLLTSSQAAILNELEEHKLRVTEKLNNDLFPRINLCNGLDEVCEMAAKVIRDAHKQKHSECRYVTFYGAASLAIPEAEYEEFGTVGGSGQQSPYQHYLGAIEAATGDKIRIRRYIRLFDQEEFEGRGSFIQREYVNWLKNQYNMLSRNPNYILANVVRAPQWGGNLARIITHGAMMEITGDGEGAVVIADDHLCETVRQYARETIIGGLDVKNPPIYFGQARDCNKSVRDFWTYLDRLESLIREASSTDEEADA